MQSASAALQTASTGWPRTPRYKVEVEWAAGVWTDETNYVLAHTLSGGSQATGSQAGPSAIGPSVADTLGFSFENSGGSYSMLTANGYGKAVRASVGMVVAGGGTEYTQVFLGHLKEPQETIRPDRVAYQALGRATRAAGQRVSTVLYTNQRADEYITTLAALLTPTPTSVVCDIGLDVYPYLWGDDESVWEEMRRVAEAEGGRIWFDGLGNLRFHNYLHRLQIASAQATFTNTRFREIVPRYDYGNLWNHIIVKYRPRFIAGLQTVWQSSEAIAVPPNSNITLWAQMQTAAYDLISPVSGTDWTARTASYISKTASINVTIPAAGAANRYAQRVLMTITNASLTQQLYVDGLQLRGYPILVTEERTAEAQDATSITAYGERVLTVDNLYIQSEEAAASIANSLCTRYKDPRLTVTLRGLRGLAYQEVGDLVHVTDVNTGIDHDFVVTDIAWTGRYNLYEQTLTGMLASSMYPYTNYFLIGTTALGGNGRVFY